MLNAGCSLRSGKFVKLQEVMTGSGGLLGDLLDLALELADLGAELVVAGLQQPIVEAADMLDRPQAVRRDAQLDALPKRIGDQGHVLQIGQERALRLVVGVGNVVSHLPALAGQLANPRHDIFPDFLGGPYEKARRAPPVSRSGRSRQRSGATLTATQIPCLRFSNMSP